MPSKDKEQQELEKLRERHQKLDRERTRAQANLDNARTRLEELRAEAKEQYGTDDLEALRTKLREMEEENERKRTEYRAHLEEVEKGLAAIDEDMEQQEDA